MLDTVGIHCEARLRDSLLTPQGSRLISVGERMKARVRDGWLVRAEGSLTRYNHGRLPRTEGELAAALRGALADIGKFAELGAWRFDRLDLAYDAAEPTAPLVRACRQFRFPGIRKAAEVADDDSSIRWGNGRTAFQVQLYDAGKRHRLAGPVSRLEIRLRKGAVEQRELERETSWTKLAEVFGEFAARLPAAAVFRPQGRLEPGQVIACLSKDFGEQAGQKAYELLAQGRSRPTVRKIRRQMNEAMSAACGKSPREAFTLPRHRNGKIFSTPPPSYLHEPR